MVDISVIYSETLETTLNFSIYKLGPAILVLLAGIIIGSIASKIIYKTLKKIRIDNYVPENKTPLINISNTSALIVKWWIYVLFFSEAISILSLTQITTFTNKIISYIPGLSIGTFIILGGYFIGVTVKENFLKVHRDDDRIDYNIIGNLIIIISIYISTALALPIIGIPSDVVSNILLIILASVGIALAIAVGLGTKDIVNERTRKYLNRFD